MNFNNEVILIEMIVGKFHLTIEEKIKYKRMKTKFD